GEADPLEELGDLRFGLSVRAPCQDDRRPCDRVADAVPRVQGVVGVLEDELELAPGIPRAVSDLRRERHAVETQAPGRRGVQARDCAGDRRLAAPRLAHERDTFSACEREAHLVNPHRSGRPTTVLRTQPVDREERPFLSRGSPVRQLLNFQRRGAHPPETPGPPPPPSPRPTRRPHRGAKAHPFGRSPTPGATPGMPCKCRGRARSGIDATSPCVYGCFGSPSTAAVRPSSTIFPAERTATRSATCETTARSWDTS